MPPEPEFDPIPVLVRFVDAGVDFVVIGAVAGGAHGSAYGTEDVDLHLLAGSGQPRAAG